MYQDANRPDRLLLVTLNSSNNLLKLQALYPTRPEMGQGEQGATEVGESQRADREDSELFHHGKEYIHFIKLYEATILYGPEDVECYFFYMTLNQDAQPERYLIKYPTPSRPFRQFTFDDQPLRTVIAVECEGSVDWEQYEG